MKINFWVDVLWLAVLGFGLIITFLVGVCFLVSEYKRRRKNSEIRKEYEKCFNIKSEHDFKNVYPDKFEIKEINLGFTKIKIRQNDYYSGVLWNVLVELSTRIIFNKLEEDTGKSKAALDSVYKCFTLIREELSKKFPGNVVFHLVLSLLNNRLRPFLAKWHKLSDRLAENDIDKHFRNDLVKLQEEIKDCKETKIMLLIFDIKIEELVKVLKN